MITRRSALIASLAAHFVLLGVSWLSGKTSLVRTNTAAATYTEHLVWDAEFARNWHRVTPQSGTGKGMYMVHLAAEYTPPPPVWKCFGEAGATLLARRAYGGTLEMWNSWRTNPCAGITIGADSNGGQPQKRRWRQSECMRGVDAAIADCNTTSELLATAPPKFAPFDPARNKAKLQCCVAQARAYLDPPPEKAPEPAGVFPYLVRY